MPKIKSLVTTLDEMETDVAAITETWLSPEHDEAITDLENRTPYSFIRRDRGPAQRGGGVAIVYRKSHIQMQKCRLPNSKYEIVAAIGRRTGPVSYTHLTLPTIYSV